MKKMAIAAELFEVPAEAEYAGFKCPACSMKFYGAYFTEDGTLYHYADVDPDNVVKHSNVVAYAIVGDGIVTLEERISDRP